MSIIEIEKIKFKNFLSFGSRWQELELQKGVTIVTGTNGVGKTSLLKTIPYGLFGKTHSNVPKAQLINWRNRKNTEVILNFTKGVHRYEILRAIKPDKLEIYQDGELLPRPANIREYQEQLEEILNINFQTFINIIHTNINSENSILKMSKPDKRKFLEKMFGLGVYSQLNQTCNKKISTIDSNIHDINMNVQHNSSTLEEIQSNIRSVKMKLSTISSDSSVQLNDVKEQLTDIQDKCLENSEYESIEKNMGEVLSQIEGLNGISSKVSRSISVLNSKFRTLDKRIIKNPSTFTKEQIADMNHLIDVNKTDVDIYNEDVNKYQVLSMTIKSKMKELEVRKETMGDGDVCPTCGQDIDNVVSHVDEEIIELQEKYFKSVKKLQTAQANHLDSSEKLEQSKSNFEKMVRAYDAQQEFERLKSRSLRYIAAEDKLEVYNDRIEATILIHTHTSNDLKESHMQESKLRNKISDLQTEMRILEEKVISETRLRNDLEEIITKDEQRVQKIDKENETLRQKIPKLNTMKDYLSYIKDMCKDEKVKSYAISRLRPMLMERANHYISEIEFPFYLSLDNWLECQIKGPGITNGSYNSLSGGEGKCVDLSLQTAFLDIARMQSGTYPDTLIYDEVLDSSIDSASITKVFDIIRAKQIEDDNKTYIISHREEIGELDYDNTIRVIKENGYSKVYNS